MNLKLNIIKVAATSLSRLLDQNVDILWYRNNLHGLPRLQRPLINDGVHISVDFITVHCSSAFSGGKMTHISVCLADFFVLKLFHGFFSKEPASDE